MTLRNEQSLTDSESRRSIGARATGRQPAVWRTRRVALAVGLSTVVTAGTAVLGIPAAAAAATARHTPATRPARRSVAELPGDRSVAGPETRVQVGRSPSAARKRAAQHDVVFSVSPRLVGVGEKMTLRSVTPCPASYRASVTITFGFYYKGTYNFIQGWTIPVSKATGEWSSSFAIPAKWNWDVYGYGGGSGNGVLGGKPVRSIPGTYYFTAQCGMSEHSSSFIYYPLQFVTLKGSDTVRGPYQLGEALAGTINRLAAAGSFRELDGSLEAGPFAQEIRSSSHDAAFASGFANHLSTDGASSVISLIGGSGYAGTTAPPPVRNIEELFVSAYYDGRVDPEVTRLLTVNLADYEKGRGVDYQSVLLSGLASSPTAATNFVQGLTLDQLEAWSQQNQGIDHETEDVALAAVEANWQWYANHLRYAGPLSPSQLAGIMYAATRDNYGRATVTNQIGPWFIAHGGTPTVSNPQELDAWTIPLTNMNGAVARPTGAYLQSAQDWIQAGKYAATTLAEEAVSFMIGKLLVEPIVGILSARVISSLEFGEFARLYAESNDFLEALVGAARYGESLAQLEERGLTLYKVLNSLTGDEQKLDGAIDNQRGTTDGIKAEQIYYFAIIKNTEHEAIARLVQEGLVVDKAQKVVPLSIGSADVEYMRQHADQFYVRSPSGDHELPLFDVVDDVFVQFYSTH